MTISNDIDVFKAYGQQGIIPRKAKMHRQSSFDNFDDLKIGLSETKVRKNFHMNACSLQRDVHVGRKTNRSSLIFDWLSNPDNQFMFQDNNIDGHVFRSNSDVQTRPANSFIKNSLYYSMREEISKITENVLDATVVEAKNQLRRKIAVSAKEQHMCVNNRAHCVLLEEHGGAMEEDSCTVTNTASSDETTNVDKEIAEDNVFCSQDSNNNDLENRFDNMSLVDRGSLFHDNDKARSTSYSLPNFARSKHRGKLRRINSDALFYRDTYRNTEKHRKLGSYTKRHSFTLKNSLDDGKSTSKERSCFFKLDTEKLLAKLESIISLGDVLEVRELAQCGFDFNAKDNAGNCALHYAALRGNDEIINEILDNGGSVWIRNNKNQLPVELASNMNVRMLLSRVTLFYREQYTGQIESHLTCKGMSFEL